MKVIVRNRAHLVAERGLWDSYCSPDSWESLKRAYAKNIPFLLKKKHFEQAERVKTLLKAQRDFPIFIEQQDGLESFLQLQNSSKIFVYSDQRIFQFLENKWQPIGFYLSLNSLRKGTFLGQQSEKAEIILFESETIESPCVANNKDAEHYALIKNRYSKNTKVFKVSDFVELELKLYLLN